MKSSMKKLYALFGLLMGGQVYAECTVSPKNYSTAESMHIKQHFSDGYMRDHKDTFDIKVLPRLRLESGMLTYQYNSYTKKASIDPAQCKVRTIKLMVNQKDKSAEFKCSSVRCK